MSKKKNKQKKSNSFAKDLGSFALIDIGSNILNAPQRKYESYVDAQVARDDAEDQRMKDEAVAIHDAENSQLSNTDTGDVANIANANTINERDKSFGISLAKTRDNRAKYPTYGQALKEGAQEASKRFKERVKKNKEKF